MNGEPNAHEMKEPSQRPLRMGLVIALLLAFIATMAWMRLERPVTRGELIGAGPLLPDMRVDLNTADAGELRLLPGIGPRLAERIVEDRLAGGEFATIDDLVRVRGIGPATVERVRPFVIVSEQAIAGVGVAD